MTTDILDSHSAITHKELKKSGWLINRWQFSFYYNNIYFVNCGFTKSGAIRGAYYQLMMQLANGDVKPKEIKL